MRRLAPCLAIAAVALAALAAVYKVSLDQPTTFFSFYAPGRWEGSLRATFSLYSPYRLESSSTVFMFYLVSPAFVIVGVSPSPLSGYAGSTVQLSVTVQAVNGSGVATVRVWNETGAVVARGSASLTNGSSYTFQLSVALPSSPGTYAWTVDVYNNQTKQVDDRRSLTVYVYPQPTRRPVAVDLRLLALLLLALLPMVVDLLVRLARRRKEREEVVLRIETEEEEKRRWWRWFSRRR